ncbi:MAG: diguanylate cyclase [Devosia nanyangense]|uniref:Diguanylate cyclase n=1 Tax=Devosia nanyangense TaxID=1228055 RepID=A0A933NY67_9HYPH|nr:diguanylate cyclase [Devosia nanyangense]
MSQASPSGDDARLTALLDVILKFAAGDLKARGVLSDDSSAVDGVMAGINILGEELEAYAAETRRINDALQQALDYARTLIESSPHGILAVDRDLRITEWNRAMTQMFGLARQEAIGCSLDEIPFARETGEAERVRAGFDGASLQPREIAYRIPGSDKQSFFEIVMAPLPNHTSGIQGAVLRVGDITERKRAAEQLRLASLYARSLIEASLDPLVTISVDGKIMDVNDAAVEATGVPRERLIGSDFSGYFTDPEKAHIGYREAFTTGGVRNFPLTMMHASGKLTEVLYNASVYHTETGEVAGVLAAARDITERRRAEQAEELASRDSLTGLYNHRTFYALLEDETVRALRFNRPLSLLMLDIDHFKAVNDTYGHQAGDAILNGLSDLLMRQARAVDRVCRYGGEEFTLVLPETDADVAIPMAERLRAEVERHRFDIGGRSVGITVSIGVATYPQQASSLEDVVKAADLALYAAKQGGRNRVSRYAAAGAGGTDRPAHRLSA